MVLLIVLGGAAIGHAEPVPRFSTEVELFGRAEYTSREGDDLSDVVLDRAELGAAVGLGPDFAAEVRLEALRSAGEGGALGVDGDSLVTRVKRGFVRGGHAFGPVQLDGALGLAPDPWIATLDEGDTTRPLSRSASERLLGWSPSDLALVARGAIGPVRATLAVGNGEGLQYPERNTGKTTTGIVEVRAIESADLTLRIAGMARDGSTGSASARAHRFGGMAALDSEYAAAGIEVVRALGLDGKGDVEGTSIGGYAEGRPIAQLAIAARGATLRLDGGSRTTFGGGIAYEPWAAPAIRGISANRGNAGRARIRIWLAVDRSTSDGTGMPLSTDPGDATTAMVIVSALAPYEVP